MCKKVLDVGWALPPPALTACRATLVLDGRKGGQELGEDFPISPTQTQIFQIYFYVCHFLRVQKPLWNSTYSIYIELKGGVGEKYQKHIKLPAVWVSVIHLRASSPSQVRVRIRTEVTGAPVQQLARPQLQAAGAIGTLDLRSGPKEVTSLRCFRQPVGHLLLGKADNVGQSVSGLSVGGTGEPGAGV